MKNSSSEANRPLTCKMMLGIVAALLVSLVLLAGCGGAPSGSSDSSETSDKAAEETQEAQGTQAAWDPDGDCGQCHAEEVASKDDSACLYSEHASVACSTCHSDVDALAKVHTDGKTDASKAKLKKTDVSDDVCLSCHKQADLAAATAGSTVLTDASGTVVNPHDIPESPEHDEICTSCHEFHVSDADLDKQAQKTCQSCHHADVYECNTCHAA